MLCLRFVDVLNELLRFCCFWYHRTWVVSWKSTQICLSRYPVRVFYITATALDFILSYILLLNRTLINLSLYFLILLSIIIDSLFPNNSPCTWRRLIKWLWASRFFFSPAFAATYTASVNGFLLLRLVEKIPARCRITQRTWAAICSRRMHSGRCWDILLLKTTQVWNRWRLWYV